MKRMNFFPMGAAAFLLAFAACTDEMTEVQSGELKQIVMTASDFETEDGSRTNFQITSSGAEFSWATNDTIGIFPNEGAQAYFPMTSGAGTKSANFTGGGWALKDASTYAAYYPFIGDFYLNKNAIPVDYTGQVQTGDASTAHLGVYDYMAAAPSTPKNGNVSFAFKHLGALVQLKFTLPQATTLNSVALTTESEAFAVNGKVDIMANSLGITSVTSSKDVTLEVKNVATTENNQVVTLYMMLPPVDLTGKALKAVVKTSNGSEEVSLDSKNFQAGKAYALSGSLKDPNGGTVAGNGTYKDGVVSIATAGTMKKLLGDNYLNIASLKVVGPINGDDMYYLRKMIGCSDFSKADIGKLTSLDLLEATIVEGGEWYSESLYTDSNVIGKNMFKGSNLQSIVLPKNTISIGESAFYGCKTLTSINIPNSVTNIRGQAFTDCENLASVKIGIGVTHIDLYAFVNCNSLTSVYITDLSSWCNISFFDISSNPLHNGAKLYLNDKEVTELTIPENITKINNLTFAGCESIIKAIIGNNITSIGKGAFYKCSSMNALSIGDGVTTISEQAFELCYNLTDLSIGKGVTTIGKNAFTSCRSLLSILIPDNVTIIGDNAFNGCSSLTSVIIGSGVTTIGKNTFMYCNALTSITIPNNVTSLGNYALAACNSLTSVTIGDGVSSIGKNTFTNCKTLTTVTIGNGVTSIEPSTFKDIISLTTIKIGDGLKTISESAFSGCSSLTSVSIGKSISKIEVYAFKGCNALTEFYCHATTPPKLASKYWGKNKYEDVYHYPFDSSYSNQTILWVPARCGAQYKSSNLGKYFKNIKEID